jgi:AcrR family transcriptional regulator
VLAALRQNRTATEKLAERRAELRAEAIDLLGRGKGAGASMNEMAEALGLTRQSLHRLIREEKRNA